MTSSNLRPAYVTMLCGGDGYVPGAEALGASLELSGTEAPRIILAASDVSRNARMRLATAGWEVRDVEPIPPPAGRELLFPRFAHVFTKLRAWELDDFDRVVFLDADTVVVRNIDELFERTDFAAAPDFFRPDQFNSGVMVLNPSQETFASMQHALSSAASYDGGDQGFLNTFFQSWYARPVSQRLPPAYNRPHFIYQFAMARPAVKSTIARETKVIHYMVQKPWQTRATLTGAAGPWWSMYFAAHPEQGTRWRKHLHSLEDRTFDYLSGLVLG